eukprot:g30716.t1
MPATIPYPKLILCRQLGQMARIYWGFISARAAALLLPQQTAEDLVLMRLACLSRVQDVKSYKDLRRAWDSLGAREQTILVDHFLCDGLEESRQQSI